MIKHFRKLKLRVLFVGGLGYRVFIICCQSVFFWILTGQFKLAVSVSIGWNLINMCLYYLYHYVFLSMFKVGREERIDTAPGCDRWGTGYFDLNTGGIVAVVPRGEPHIIDPAANPCLVCDGTCKVLPCGATDYCAGILHKRDANLRAYRMRKEVS